MSIWLLLSILAPFLWAITNITDVILRRNYIKDDFTLTWFTSITDLPVLIGLLIIGGIPTFHILPSTGLLISGLLSIIPLYFYYKALEFEEPSRIAIFFQFIPIATLLIATLFLNESLNFNQVIAFVLILSGGILASIKKNQNDFKISAALWLMIISSILYAISFTLFKAYEPSYQLFIQALSWYYIGRMIFPFGSLLSQKHRAKIRYNTNNLNKSSITLFLTNIIADALAVGALNYAVTLGKVSLTAVITGIQPLFVFTIAIIMGKQFLIIPKENLKPFSLTTKASAFTLIIIGLYFLS
jgi:drug/metabolite transporter (DMT)-like permease